MERGAGCVRIQVCRPLGKALSIMGIMNTKVLRILDEGYIKEIRSIRDIWIIVGFRLIRVIEDNRHIRVKRVIRGIKGY